MCSLAMRLCKGQSQVSDIHRRFGYVVFNFFSPSTINNPSSAIRLFFDLK
jgi:hypothetical protein